MPPYDRLSFTPPAPVAHVTLRRRDTGAARLDVPMLLDTGADVTLVPRQAVEPLGVPVSPERVYELVGFDGSKSPAPVVELDLVFLGRTFRGLFLLVDQDWGILGRNILNAVRLSLDGPGLSWDEVPAGAP